MEKKLIGNVSVDSGQIIIVDPAYLDRYVVNDFNYETGVKKGNKRYSLWQKIDGTHINWATPIKKEGGKTMNDLAEEGWEVFEEYPDKGSFSYSGVSSVTSSQNFGEITAAGLATAIVSTSGYGDGNYPVTATIEDGRVVKLEIDFK
ncbi:MAG: DUF4241 domain-containing protein [Chlamydiae bacterium]|nr:DUF4241 domain-containing protein [Chlamydiota bacterium]